MMYVYFLAWIVLVQLVVTVVLTGVYATYEFFMVKKEQQQ